ncbi:MAG: glycoside hydrolase family 1 protein [Propionibacteriaceae bacterium]|jgi:beta-glucosidase|nr:glycoside hydrolase family 1 protein [Propionibacteriaceae bacterium]
MRLNLGSLALGVATSATQIEGGSVDTNWHRWADQVGKVKDGSTPARAVDHWNRLDEDIALLGELGIAHYRMGLEWARIEPKDGVFDEHAIAHYRSELMKLRAAGITPLVTLHHFNNPGWLEERGAWERHSTIAIFLRYVKRIVQELSDLVTDWITINEPSVYATFSYAFGDWPPGRTSIPTAMKVMSHLAQAHCRAYNLIHALQDEAQVGLAHHLRVFDPANRLNPLDIAGAKAMAFLFQDAMLEACSYGHFRYPLKPSAAIKPGIYFDFTGVNYYSRSWVSGFSQGTRPGCEVNDLGWEYYPEGMGRVLEMVAQRCPGPIFITENGTADAADVIRPRFLYDHLAAIIDSGARVDRYYHWSFIDNWEWIEGEDPRFGLVHVDYDTQVRTIRDSGRFYADLIANAGCTDEAYARWVA